MSENQESSPSIEVIPLSITPTTVWGIYDQRHLNRLRNEISKGRRVQFLLHREHPQLSMLQQGVPYEIDLLQHTDLCFFKAGGATYGFSAHVLLTHFTPIYLPGAEYPFTDELSLDQVYQCADRWLALGKLPTVTDQGAFGFDEVDREEVGTYRSCRFHFATAPDHDASQDPHDRAVALSKLTEMADLMRAKEIEDRIEQVQQDKNS